MIYVLAVLYFVQCYGLILAIRRLMKVQKQLRADSGEIGGLRSRNASLLSKMVDHMKETKVAQDYYRDLFNRTDDMIFVYAVAEGGGPGEMLEVNDSMCDRLGYKRSEILEMTLLDIEADDMILSSASSGSSSKSKGGEYMEKYIAAAREHSTRTFASDVVKKGRAVAERVFRRKDGAMIPVEVVAKRLDRAEGPAVLCTAHDLSEKIEKAEELRSTQTLFEGFFNRSPFGIAIYHPNRALVRANTACLQIFGFMDDEQMERFSLFDNPFLEKDLVARLRAGENVRYDLIMDFDEAVEKGYMVTVRKGRGHFVVNMNNMGYDSSRKCRGFFAQVQDISEHRRVEDQLRQLEAAAGDGGGHVDGIAGSLKDMGFTDMIQVLCAGGKDARIELKRNDTNAKVFIRGGEIVHCEVDDVSGPDAFYDLMRWRDGDFVTKQCAEFPEPTITISAMGLLMEGARLSDEGA